MTAHVHDPIADGDRPRPGPAGAGDGALRSARPRWLVPGLAVGIIAAALVVAGVFSVSTVLYAGLFGGMLLMHAGGHGGHGGHPGGHESHGGGTADGAEDLSQPSSGSQPIGPGSDGGLDNRASIDRRGGETHDHDQHNSHGCH